MSRKEKALVKLLTGAADASFALDDLVQILLRLDFVERTSGSHRIFTKEGIEGILNLQRSKDGKAKRYQVRQVRDFLILHRLVHSADDKDENDE